MSQMLAKSTTLAELKSRTGSLPPDTPLGFFSAGGLDLMQRAAMMLSHSTLVPAAYRARIIKRNRYGQIEREEDNPNALSNCVLALNMAQRMNADPLMVMQNLYIVENRPAWSSQFIIAAINACGKFSPLRFELVDEGEKDFTWEEKIWEENPQTGKSYRKSIPHKARIHDFSCIAWATEKASGERLSSPRVSIAMAISDGWYGKEGSKWKTMPEIMLRYRAASFFGKLYAPELLMGIATAEEVQDTIELSPQGDGSFGHDESGPVAMTTADIAAQADAAAGQTTGQTTEKDAQPAAAAPQEPAKRQRLSGEELDALRKEALHAYEAKGYDLKKAEWDAGRALSFWTMTDCKRLIREAAKLQPKATSEVQGAAAQEQPEAPQSKESPAPDSTQASGADTAPEPEQEQVQAFVPPYQTFTCPHNGAQITEDDCYDCKHRTGCPHWEAAPPADA